MIRAARATQIDPNLKRMFVDHLSWTAPSAKAHFERFGYRLRRMDI